MSELRTPREWAAGFGVEIIDSDGWRTNDAPAFSEPITLEDFSRRVAVSTIRMDRLDMPDVDPNEPQGGGCCGGGCSS